MRRSQNRSDLESFATHTKLRAHELADRLDPSNTASKAGTPDTLRSAVVRKLDTIAAAARSLSALLEQKGAL